MATARVQIKNRGHEYPIDTRDYADLQIAPLNPVVRFHWQTTVPGVTLAAALVALASKFSSLSDRLGGNGRYFLD